MSISPAIAQPFNTHGSSELLLAPKTSMGHKQKLQNWTQWWLTGSCWLAADTNLFYANANSTYKGAGLAVPES